MYHTRYAVIRISIIEKYMLRTPAAKRLMLFVAQEANHNMGNWMADCVPLTHEQMDAAMRKVSELIKSRDAWRDVAAASANEVIRLRLELKARKADRVYN